MRKMKSKFQSLLALTAIITVMNVPMAAAITDPTVNSNESISAVNTEPILDDVVCKCKKVFLGNKCAANGTDGNQCNGSDQCSDYDGNCH